MEIEYCLGKANPASGSLQRPNYEHKAWEEDAKTILHVVGYAVTRLSNRIKSAGRSKGGQAPEAIPVQHKSNQDLESLPVIQNLQDKVQDPTTSLAKEKHALGVFFAQAGKSFLTETKKRVICAEKCITKQKFGKN